MKMIFVSSAQDTDPGWYIFVQASSTSPNIFKLLYKTNQGVIEDLGDVGCPQETQVAERLAGHPVCPDHVGQLTSQPGEILKFERKFQINLVNYSFRLTLEIDFSIACLPTFKPSLNNTPKGNKSIVFISIFYTNLSRPNLC